MQSPYYALIGIGFSIAIPAVVFTLGGRWLDSMYGTEPWFTIIGLFVSIPVAAMAVWRKIKPLM